jgi:hypothetical protein
LPGVHSEVPPHEKIRFRRCDIASLDALPSAVPLPRHARLARLSRRSGRIALGVVAGLCLALALVLGVIVAGFGDSRLRIEAQDAIAALAGEGSTVAIGGVGVSLDGLRGLALQIDDIAVTPREPGALPTRIGSARLGLSILPLLRGELKTRRIAVSDATVALAALPGNGAGMAVMDENGLVDPDRVGIAVFGGIRSLAAVLDARGMRRIEASNIEIALPAEAIGTVRLIEASLRRRPGDGMRLSATVEAMGRSVTVEGKAALDPASRRVATLELDVALQAPEAGAEGQKVGAATLALAGGEASQGDRLSLSGRVEAAEVPIGRRARMIADVDFAATALSGTGKLEIERLRVASGRSVWDFHGAVGPVPDGEIAAGREPAYRYELVSDGSTVSPALSFEPTLRVAARIAGHLDAAATTLSADEIGVRSDQGEVSGHGLLRVEPGKAPALRLRIDAGAMPVSHAKQLWPWFAAPPAQRWVTSNVFGGRLAGGWVELDVPAGRFGDGTPLRHDEVSGYFKVEGARFDVAGRIPPVRDGSGTVAFFGTDVEIALESGTVYMPSGRTVAASNGRLDVRAAHIKPTIGKLDIDVAGEADAILELASYDPIDVGRFIDLKPDDLGGKVEGNVVADIPLQRGVALDRLGWKVALAYEELAIARPFEGQAVTAANGTIVVDPQRAVIEAKAELNGLPATLSLVEPLGAGADPRRRHIAVELDDKARAAFAPGLDMLLSGVTRLELDGGDPAALRRITADLQPATLTIPWIGWSKGPGVPASVSFAMASANGRTELSDFTLRGETFAATGTVSLRGGSVERVSFPSMRLNRGDDFSLDVARKGDGYAVTVRGERLDARSAIKLHTGGGGGAGGEAVATAQVAVDIKVDSLAGFHGEILRDVTLRYAGAGGRNALTEFSATTASGARVSFRDGADGGTRAVTMQSADAGALLRFLDIYEHMEGGRIALSLTGREGEALRGQIDARDFWLVDEPRLSSIVSTPSTQDGRSLNQAVRGSLDTSRVQFERGYANVTRGTNGGKTSLSLDRGILRGPMIGVSFQGVLNDGNGNMAMTGTFMPAYGLNRIFGEIPIIGQILGNGRDRGLIGITFRLAGRTSEPRLDINPLSVIAPGIFRSVFEFR